jgi:parvulin-like peptidyl-prolyl isomerase
MVKMVIMLLTSLTLNAAQKSDIVAKVDKIEITRQELINKMSVSYFSRTLDELIEEKLLLNWAEKNKIKVDKKEIEDFLKQIKSRFNSENEFKNELKRMNITEEGYKKMIENTLTANKALEKILNINITDEDLKKYYENNKNQFKIPKALKLRQIYLNTEQEANDVYLALEAGADFKKLSALKSADPVLKEKEGDIGFISKGMLLPELEKEIFLLEVGKYTKPLKTGNGYSIIKVEEIREEKELSFEEIKDRLREVLKSNIISANRRNVIENLKSQAKIEIK